MTLLQIVQQVLSELAFGTTQTVIGSSESNVQTVLAMVQRLGTDLTREDNWQRLIREHVITTRSVDRKITCSEGSRNIAFSNANSVQPGWVISCEAFPRNTRIESLTGTTGAVVSAPATKTGQFDGRISQIAYPLPADWKCQIPQTEWDSTSERPMAGPLNAQQWAEYKHGIADLATIRRLFRIRGNELVLASPAPDGIVCAYEYVSRNWVIGSDNTYKPQFTADTDTCVFDPSLMIVGTKVRFLQRAGLDATIETSEFQHIYQMVRGQDASSPVLSISPSRAGYYLSNRNIPDGDWRV